MAKKNNLKYYLRVSLGAALVILFWLGATTEIKIFGNKPDELLVDSVLAFLILATIVMAVLATPILIYQFIKLKRRKAQPKTYRK